MEKTIKVCGQGKISLRPDTIQATININGVEKEYFEALQKSNEYLTKIKDSIKESGFDENELKSTDFRIETKYENNYTPQGGHTSKFVGYEYKHELKISFAADNKLLGKMIAALINSKAEPIFSFAYTIKDASTIKDVLLGEAIRDCCKKALILASSAKVNLGEIINIDCTTQDSDFFVRPARTFNLASADILDNSVPMEINPEDINISNSVTVVWSIN